MSQRDKRVWMFNSGDTFTGNPKWLFVYVTKFRPDITAYWLCETEETARYVRGLGYKALTFKSPQAPALFARTGVYVVNQVKEVIPDELRGAVFLNLWHGVGVKGVERAMNKGYLEERIAKKYIRHNALYRNNQLFLVTSPMMEENFRRQLGLDDESIVRGGYPQNLYPQHFGDYSTYDHDVLARRGLPAGTKVALYAPTPRRTSTPDFLRRAFPDMERLVQTLERNDTLLILKMHPHMSKDRYFRQLKESFGDRRHLMFWDNSEDVYEIFPKIDLAVMDYSSILYDMMDAGVRSFVRYIFDYDDGNDVVAPGFDYLGLSCGTVASTFEELLEVLGQDNRVDDAKLAELEEAFWAYSSKESMEQMVDRALEYEIRDLPLKTLHTFDVFDTVIHRRGVTPASVFLYVKNRMETSDLGFPRYLVDRFPEVRQQAESAERDRRRRNPQLVRDAVLEITFEEIYERIADVFDLTPEQTAALAEWEVEGELASCFADTEMVARIREILDGGDPVVLISDMYLPREVVTNLLKTADPFLAELPLYLSSDNREQKATKSLYLKLYREIGYDFAEWVHHGDAPWGDVKQARALGITVDIVPRTKLGRFETDVVEDIPTFDGHLYAGMLRSFRMEGPHRSAENYAFNHVGSYLVPYVDWVVRDAVRRGYRTLYFVSRDGYHLKRVADALIEERGLDLKTRYIYGSRTAWRIASQVDRLDEDLFEPHGDFLNARTVDALLTNARLGRAEFAAMFPEFATLTDAELDDAQTRTAVVAAFEGSDEFRAHLLRAAAEERALVARYFRQEMNLDEPFAVVEYWGRGYTQTCMTRILAEAAGRPIDNPVYYARAVLPTEGHSIRHRFTTATHSMLFVEAIFANLPHGTVLGYEDRGDRVEPIVRPRANNAELHDALERELVEYAHRFGALDFLDVDRIARDVFRFGFEYFRRENDAPVFVRNLAPLHDAVALGTKEQEYAPGMTRRDLKEHLSGNSFQRRTRSMPLTLARSSEWVRLNYELATERKNDRTPAPRRLLLRSEVLVRTGMRRARRVAGAARRRVTG